MVNNHASRHILIVLKRFWPQLGIQIHNPETLPSIAINSAPPSPPSTPPRRDRKYPQHLGHRDPGRVPLHRRETADKYEHLEDLLREAGYKETRIFTPEADKSAVDADEGNKSSGETDANSKRGGVGSVVGFLAGLIPGATKQDISESDVTGVYANPVNSPQSESPLAHKAPIKNQKFTITPRPSATHRVSPDANSDSSSGSQRLNRNKQLYSLRTNQHSIQSQASSSSKSLATRALLRHMASAPNMPKDHSNVRSVYDTGAEDRHPPLPSAWLDIVKQAVISSGTFGVHTGQPVGHPPTAVRTRRKKENSSAFDSYTDHRRGRQSARNSTVHLAPHPLTLRTASPGPVSTVNVICKSVPGSRSSSAVRGSYRRGVLDIGRLDLELRGKGKERGRGLMRPGQDLSDGVPSLVTTRVDGDNMELDGLKDAYQYDDDEEEEEGELDLSQLLVPPKRQRSIRSLRRHLEKHRGLGVGNAGKVPGIEIWRPEHDSDHGWSVTRGRWRDSPEEQDAKIWGLPGLSDPTTKRRGGIPNSWGNG
jgi:hypothetical protein